MKNKIVDLRDHLFAQLERLSDDDLDLDKEIKRSHAMVEIAEVIVDSAKAENEFIRITQGDGSGFIPYSLNGKSSEVDSKKKLN